MPLQRHDYLLRHTDMQRYAMAVYSGRMPSFQKKKEKKGYMYQPNPTHSPFNSPHLFNAPSSPFSRTIIQPSTHYHKPIPGLMPHPNITTSATLHPPKEPHKHTNQPKPHTPPG